MDNFDVVPTALAVKAMQDSGFKNAAFAVAELIDNSIQAGASVVRFLCEEEAVNTGKNTVRAIRALVVADNGRGMDPLTLRMSLQFGNGTNLNNRSGIGRFGMGLPNSSLSQGDRVEVYSWQAGIESAMFSYLDLEELTNGQMKAVPEPVPAAVPPKWIRRVGAVADSESGTIVIWPKLTRCNWRTSKSVRNNSEEVIGRMYRHHISRGQVSIQMATCEGAEMKDEAVVRPTDPLYLMTNTTCPAPWEVEPMAEPHGEPQRFRIEYRGGEHYVTVRWSLAKKSARYMEGAAQGRQAHGKHAKRHMGLSLVRAERELALYDQWCRKGDIDRWIGCEVSFEPELDELFGVTNNKQAAVAWGDLAGKSVEDIAASHGLDGVEDLTRLWLEEGDPRSGLLPILREVHNRWKSLLKELEADGKREKSKRHRFEEEGSPERRGTLAVRRRLERGEDETQSDRDELAPAELRTADLVSELVEHGGLSPEDAAPAAARVVDSGLKFYFTHKPEDSDAFFTVKSKAGAILINLNTDHPVYENLVAPLESTEADSSDRGGSHVAHVGLRLLLEAWARMEDERSDRRRDEIRRVREAWGWICRDFLGDD